MTLAQFIKKYKGKTVDYDNAYGGQCVDLVRQYVKEVLNTTQPGLVSGAYQIFESAPAAKYHKITNTPSGVPNAGDIMVWKKSSRLPYGHCSIFTDGDVREFQSFDQNWPLGSKCRYVMHNYEGVKGWLRKKEVAKPKPKPAPVKDTATLEKVYALLKKILAFFKIK